MQFLNGFQVKSPPLLQWLNELLTTLCLTRIWGKAFYTDDGDPLRALVVFFSSLWKTDEANSKSKGVYLTCLEQSSCKRGSYFTLFGSSQIADERQLAGLESWTFVRGINMTLTMLLIVLFELVYFIFHCSKRYRGLKLRPP